MIYFELVSKAIPFRYLKLLKTPAALCIVMMMILTGCDRPKTAGGLGSIAGVAQLSNPDPGTGHAGILVYLAGTAYQARTDQQGRYRIDGIPAGTYDLIAEKPGYQGQVIEALVLAPDVNTSTTPLQPATTLLTRDQSTTGSAGTEAGLGSISGTVLLDGMPDENGGVRVEVDGTAFVTVSSNDGEYRILNVDPGEYHLSYYREGYLPYTTPEIVTVTSSTVTKVADAALELVQPGDRVSPADVAAAEAARAVTPKEIEPPPGPDDARSIVGLVELVNEDGKASNDFSNVTIAINGSNKIAEVNDQGQFRFDSLTSGTYTLIGTIPDGPVVQIPVDLETQRRATVSVRLVLGAASNEAGDTIRGRVVLVDLDDQPLDDSSGVKVAINGTQSMATTAADGTFSITGAPPGTYTLSASKEGFKPGEAANVAVNSAAPVDVGEIRMMVDVKRPRVVSTDPADNAKDVAIGFNLPITVKFSDKMDIGSVTAAVSLSPKTPFTLAMGNKGGGGADDSTLVITLSNDNSKSPIQFGAEYTVTIAGTAANVDGVTMGDDYRFRFRTANPGVISVSPKDGSKDIYVDQIQNPVLFSFNTRLDPESINSRTIRVKPATDTSVSTTYNNASETGWTTIRVATRWLPDTKYTVTITRRVKAFNGQRLGNTPYTIHFKTAAIELIPLSIPTVR